MRIAIIGLPGVGKTTIYSALTSADLPVGGLQGGGRVEVSSASVEVPEPRLQALSDVYQPKKTTPTRITFGDVAGMDENAGFPGEFVDALSQWEGLVLILRAFTGPTTTAPPDPQRELEMVESELLLNDLVRVERRLERLGDERQKGGRDRAELDREAATFERMAVALRAERPLRDLGLSDLGHHDAGLLSLKPLLAVLNLEENGKEWELETQIPFLAVYGKLEMELSQLSSEEAESFRSEFGVEKSGSASLIRFSRELLDRITFFTVSEREVKAWLLREGGTALEAAGTIHTDMARGFIRAEVISWQELVELRGLSQARAAGKLRVEGKDYLPADGEVIQIRFNV